MRNDYILKITLSLSQRSLAVVITKKKRLNEREIIEHQNHQGWRLEIIELWNIVKHYNLLLWLSIVIAFIH